MYNTFGGTDVWGMVHVGHLHHVVLVSLLSGCNLYMSPTHARGHDGTRPECIYAFTIASAARVDNSAIDAPLYYAAWRLAQSACFDQS